jgi:hypothetical protein
MTLRHAPRFTVDELEWLQRQLASLSKDTAGTTEGRRWKHWHDWAWAELQYRRGNGEPSESTIRAMVKEGEELRKELEKRIGPMKEGPWKP